MNRRLFLSITASLAMLGTSAAFAQTEGVVPAADILKALTAPQSKDIRLDPQGRPMPPRDPSIDLQVQFKLNSAELLPVGRMQLDQLGFALQNKMLIESGIELAGHTDRSGTYEHNMRLSQGRAESVRAYLMNTQGIAPRRLIAAGYGYNRLADPSNPKGAINRRVEVRRITVVSPTAEVYPPNAGGAPTQFGGRIVPAPRQ